MIFISLGTQKFQFNRLLMYIDNLIEEGIITDDVFAQIGYSNYIPKFFKYVKSLSDLEFNMYVNNCDIFITHGGVGSILEGIKQGKKVIAVPRKVIYREHVDNHQEEVVNKMAELKYILYANSEEDLKDRVINIQLFSPKKIELKLNDAIKNEIKCFLKSMGV